MWTADAWNDYEILDCSCGEKLERWGNSILIRPDPQVIWRTPKDPALWAHCDARYARSSDGGGKWIKTGIPEQWTIRYKNLVFQVKPMNFKHTGIFPEQAANWEWVMEKISSAGRPIRVLNLFAYTGGASLACAAAGASVCHVDAAKGMVAWARENAILSGLRDCPIRWIVDDCKKFLEREIRRGHRYDALILDPPSYGRGPSGETWKIDRDLYAFLELCTGILSENPLFVMISSYTAGLAPSVLRYLLDCLFTARFGGRAVCDELGLPVTRTGSVLPCGAAGRWVKGE